MKKEFIRYAELTNQLTHDTVELALDRSIQNELVIMQKVNDREWTLISDAAFMVFALPKFEQQKEALNELGYEEVTALRPEVIELLREKFPVSTQIKVSDSAYPTNIGIQGKLVRILDTGHFELVGIQMNHLLAYSKNTFQIIQE